MFFAGLAATYSSTRLSGSTIGAAGFHGRVRDGIGCWDLRYSYQAGKKQTSRGCERDCVVETIKRGLIKEIIRINRGFPSGLADVADACIDDPVGRPHVGRIDAVARHIIAESLAVGTPVLISDQTPWRDLDAHGVGWDLPLHSEQSFVDAIEATAEMSSVERKERRRQVLRYGRVRLSDPAVLSANRRLFTEGMGGESYLERSG